MPLRIILASSSPRRKDILKEMGYNFTVIPSDFDEEKIKIEDSDELVQTLAEGKAKEVASRVKNSLVIAADTLVVFQNKILGKPKDSAEAGEMLRRYSQSQCLVKTGFYLINTETGKTMAGVETSVVKMRAITEEEIDFYVSTGEPFDKSGGFAIEGPYSDKFVESFEGSYANIVGLPKERLAPLMEDMLNNR